MEAIKLLKKITSGTKVFSTKLFTYKQKQETTPQSKDSRRKSLKPLHAITVLTGGAIFALYMLSSSDYVNMSLKDRVKLLDDWKDVPALNIKETLNENIAAENIVKRMKTLYINDEENQYNRELKEFAAIHNIDVVKLSSKVLGHSWPRDAFIILDDAKVYVPNPNTHVHIFDENCVNALTERFNCTSTKNIDGSRYILEHPSKQAVSVNRWNPMVRSKVEGHKTFTEDIKHFFGDKSFVGQSSIEGGDFLSSTLNGEPISIISDLTLNKMLVRYYAKKRFSAEQINEMVNKLNLKPNELNSTIKMLSKVKERTLALNGANINSSELKKSLDKYLPDDINETINHLESLRKLWNTELQPFIEKIDFADFAKSILIGQKPTLLRKIPDIIDDFRDLCFTLKAFSVHMKEGTWDINSVRENLDFNKAGISKLFRDIKEVRDITSFLEERFIKHIKIFNSPKIDKYLKKYNISLDDISELNKALQKLPYAYDDLLREVKFNFRFVEDFIINEPMPLEEKQKRAKLFLALQELTRKEIAKDFNRQIGVVTLADGFHQDMKISEGPGESWFVPDNSLSAQLIDHVIKHYPLDDKDKAKLLRYKKNALLEGKKMDQIFDMAAEQLAGLGFKVRRVPGIFYDSLTSEGKTISFEDTNFMNSRIITNNDGESCIYTKSSEIAALDSAYINYLRHICSGNKLKVFPICDGDNFNTLFLEGGIRCKTNDYTVREAVKVE